MCRAYLIRGPNDEPSHTPRCRGGRGEGLRRIHHLAAAHELTDEEAAGEPDDLITVQIAIDRVQRRPAEDNAEA